MPHRSLFRLRSVVVNSSHVISRTSFYHYARRLSKNISYKNSNRDKR